jgi:NAD(P)-dependent dehydrogenase (short-subunit alcohol dehydrogenase family)
VRGPRGGRCTLQAASLTADDDAGAAGRELFGDCSSDAAGYGATTGIGQVVAGQVAAGGAHVVISGRDRSRGRAARAAAVACGGSVDFVAADLADGGGVQRLAERALDLCEGHVDIVINNAALYPHLSTADQGVDVLTLLFKRRRPRTIHPGQNAGTADDPARQLRVDVVGVRLRRGRHRRLCPADPGLASRRYEPNNPTGSNPLSSTRKPQFRGYNLQIVRVTSRSGVLRAAVASIRIRTRKDGDHGCGGAHAGG